ncbi:hypothetical protein BDV41DRAFT_581608 [Aspergillus transmontanensis]|uniref:Uncharacterized protein n=1 Tax=Aspergillus transmontanensis TaxID=1034304 RepID=A0A5N6VI77_9EURO|nr:hypothetical protein BDV41DRAFT_581608 [Aspergillus transmontanensis]
MGWAWFFSLWAVTLLANKVACQQMPPCTATCMETGNASNTMCGIEPRDISHITKTVTSVFMDLAIAFTLMRCSESPDHFGPEDIFVVLALMFALPNGALEYPMAKDGHGKDIWTVPFDSITHILKFTWVL